MMNHTHVDFYISEVVINIASGNGLVLIRHQAITWSNDDDNLHSHSIGVKVVPVLPCVIQSSCI